MAFAGSQHQTANDIQKLLIASIKDAATDGKDKAQLARAWEALERLKREMRGIPPLKASDLIGTLKRLPNAQRAASASPLEITAEPIPMSETPKNAFSETVTAPPSQTTHHLDE